MTIRTMSIKDNWRDDIAYSKIICTRYFPRFLGMTKKEIAESKDIDWLPQLAPSRKLLKEWKDGNMSWDRFGMKYNDEMYYGYDFLWNDEIRKKLGKTYEDYYLQYFLLGRIWFDCVRGDKDCILICYEKEGELCHRHLLKQLIEVHGINAMRMFNVARTMIELREKGLVE